MNIWDEQEQDFSQEDGLKNFLVQKIYSEILMKSEGSVEDEPEDFDQE